MNTMSPEQKKRRFRELARHDNRIRTGRQLAEEREQPYLPLINDIVTEVGRKSAQGRLCNRLESKAKAGGWNKPYEQPR
jgi:hypothetical protein